MSAPFMTAPTFSKRTSGWQGQPRRAPWEGVTRGRRQDVSASAGGRGSGWLRTPTFGSSTAEYELKGAASTVGVAGLLKAELATMIEARNIGRATLVLDDGASVSIDVIELTPEGLAFEVRRDDI